MELVDVMCDGSMRALANVVHEKGLTLDDAQIDAVTLALRQTILAEYDEVVAVGKDALTMGNEVLRTLVNAACMAAAIKALQQVGLLPQTGEERK